MGSTDRACLLGTARTLSTVFAEKRPLATTADAVAVLRAASPTTARSAFDARLLAVWLDVATGSVALAAPVDADGNGSTETTVGAFLDHRGTHPQRLLGDVERPARRSRAP